MAPDRHPPPDHPGVEEERAVTAGPQEIGPGRRDTPEDDTQAENPPREDAEEESHD